MLRKSVQVLIDGIVFGLLNFVADTFKINRTLFKVLILLPLLGWGVKYIVHLPVFDKMRAESAAERHFTEFYMEVQHFKCVKDSEDKKGYKDGWSSCTYTMKENPNKMLTLQCDTSMIFNTGCKRANVRTVD